MTIFNVKNRIENNKTSLSSHVFDFKNMLGVKGRTKRITALYDGMAEV